MPRVRGIEGPRDRGSRVGGALVALPCRYVAALVKVQLTLRYCDASSVQLPGESFTNGVSRVGGAVVLRVLMVGIEVGLVDRWMQTGDSRRRFTGVTQNKPSARQ